MPNLTSVGITAGVPTSGTGTVSTIDNIPALWDKGSGTGGTVTQRVIVDSSQLSALGQNTMVNSQPVVIASNQSKILVTPDSVALPANQSVNLSQVAGTTTAVGSGVQATALRTTLATDSPGIVALGQTTKSASVPVTIASDQMGVNTAANSLPVTFAPNVGALGSYSMALSSGTMAAGLGAASPIVSFRYGGANLVIVRKVIFSAGDTSTAFTAGVFTFNMFAARSFSASDTGGTAATLTGNNGKLRTSYGTTAISDFRCSSTATLTAGTRTLDSTALSSTSVSDPATAGNTIINAGTILFSSNAGEQPLILANNEGFVIQATVPATGTWTFSVQVYWDEVTAF